MGRERMCHETRGIEIIGASHVGSVLRYLSINGVMYEGGGCSSGGSSG